jgi:polar amino acid transport system permease protein
MIDFPLIYSSLPNLLEGLMLSLVIATFSCILGMILGMALGVLQSEGNGFVGFLVGTYVTIIRGTPMLVQIVFIFYVLPQFGLDISPLWSAVLAIGLNSSAYVSQIIRSGIGSVPPGQKETAYTLGFSKMQSLRYIVIPQAIRVVLPALGNEFSTLVKDSSLASIVGVMELTKQGSVLRSQTYDAFSILLAVALLYLAVTSILSVAVFTIENKLKVSNKL